MDEAMRPVIPIKLGVTRRVIFKRLRGAGGAPFDPTGWTIHGVARAGNERGEEVATWRDSPSEGEGHAEVVDADTEADPSADVGDKWIYLHITPAMSDGWTFRRAPLDVEIHEPGGEQRQEVFSAMLETIPTTVRP